MVDRIDDEHDQSDLLLAMARSSALTSGFHHQIERAQTGSRRRRASANDLGPLARAKIILVHRLDTHQKMDCKNFYKIENPKSKYGKRAKSRDPFRWLTRVMDSFSGRRLPSYPPSRIAHQRTPQSHWRGVVGFSRSLALPSASTARSVAPSIMGIRPLQTAARSFSSRRASTLPITTMQAPSASKGCGFRLKLPLSRSPRRQIDCS